MNLLPPPNSYHPKNTIQSSSFCIWLDELKFYELELKACTLNLEKIVCNIEGYPSALPKIEHFQNQFLINQMTIKKLKLEIRRFNRWHTKLTGKFEKLRSKQYRTFLKSKMDSFRRVYDELLNEFKSFFRNDFLIAHYTF